MISGRPGFVAIYQLKRLQMSGKGAPCHPGFRLYFLIKPRTMPVSTVPDAEITGNHGQERFSSRPPVIQPNTGMEETAGQSRWRPFVQTARVSIPVRAEKKAVPRSALGTATASRKIPRSEPVKRDVKYRAV